jgi:hypothetical protein
MQQFTENVLTALKNKPGLTKERLALAMNVEYDEQFRNALSAAHDAGLIHKVQDKYYPGSLKSY